MTVHAHSIPDRVEDEWEALADHLDRVGQTASRLASSFGASEAALAAGLLHDIGKNSAAFQAYIRGLGPSPDHSTAGAIEAVRLYPGPLGRLLAFCVAGHHSGLADGAGAGGSLDARLGRTVPDYRGWETQVPALPADATPRLRDLGTDLPYSLAFLGRMVFSCLVDANFIETERFYAGGVAGSRGGHAGLASLRDRLDGYLARFAGRDGPVDAHRAAILTHARAKAALAPGLFTMTVPTGGGKTLAGFAFALDHAIRHGLTRVVYVIPYAGAWIETCTKQSA